MKKRNLTAREKNTLIEKIAESLRSKEHVTFAYIFGSFVSEKIFSDIDIGVFITDVEPESYLNLEIALERELEKTINFSVDVRIINSAPLAFVYNILKNRILIKDNEKSLRVDFEGLIYKKYFDFKHLRDEYLREINNAPV